MRMALALAAVTVAPAALPPPNVAHLVLQPEQVGKGYVMEVGSAGKGVKAQPTLNLCGTDYPSEGFRAARLQATYRKPGSATQISNEVVTYRAGAAVQAMREAVQHAVGCPNRPIATGVAGLPKLKFTITRIADPKLLKGYLAVRVVVTGTVKGKHILQTSYAVYQRLGNVLSGVYSFLGTSAGQRALCLHAAEQSARNLRRGTSGVSSGPTA
jgi:hypothetical protein